jgi:A/G-specific adenine glycosylase
VGQDVSGARSRLRRLRRWHSTQRRSFPWRSYRSSWRVFLAEMLLLRTRADQVAQNVSSIVKLFPSARKMAIAPLSKVEDALKPLGLNWRARRLHQAAEVIVACHRGRVPLNINALVALPGVGPYVASSTVAALTGAKVTLVDANTVRVATRVAGLRMKGDVRRRPEVLRAINRLMGGAAVASDWLAVLDLAAAICVPRTPSCSICPIRSGCAFALTRRPPRSAAPTSRRPTAGRKAPLAGVD